jgi:ribonuclease Z
MECVLLGTGGMMPMPGRPLTAVAVRTGGAVYLLDCGEGTQVPYKAQHVGMRALRLVALTHLHADHCLGLPGVLMLRSQMEEASPLTIVGPQGIERFTRNVIRDLACRITFRLDFVELDPRESPDKKDPLPVAHADDLVTLRWLPLRHSVFCVGYRLEEHLRPGKFSVEAAQRLDIPPGPLFGRLQSGEAVTLPDGRTIAPDEVLGPPRSGRHMAFCTDTSPCKNLYRVLQDVDLAFLEGMFLPEHAEEAALKRHLAVADAARIAGRAGARQTVLVHLSPRYDNRQARQVDEVAKAAAPGVRRGRDGERFAIKLRD